MGKSFTRDDLTSPKGRRAANWALMIGDHGLLRLFYDNSHEIAAQKLWRTYQPSESKLKSWKKRGIRTVINLRGKTPAGHYVLEEEACERLALTLVNFQVYSREAPAPSIVHGAIDLFKTIEYPAIMHCKSGADRAGLMGVLFRYCHQGKPLGESLEQLSFRYGHVRQGKTGILDFVFERFKSHAAENNLNVDDCQNFLNWIDSPAYDPATLKQEFVASWWGTALTEKILRRE